jgi:hypothetical protein
MIGLLLQLSAATHIALHICALVEDRPFGPGTWLKPSFLGMGFMHQLDPKLGLLRDS